MPFSLLMPRSLRGGLMMLCSACRDLRSRSCMLRRRQLVLLLHLCLQPLLQLLQLLVQLRSFGSQTLPSSRLHRLLSISSDNQPSLRSPSTPSHPKLLALHSSLLRLLSQSSMQAMNSGRTPSLLPPQLNQRHLLKVSGKRQLLRRLMSLS